MTNPPQLPQDRLDQMVAYATSFPQDKRKAGWLEIFRQYPKRMAFGFASAAIAASIIFVVSVAPPQKTVHKVARDDVADLMMYDLLEDLS